MMKLNLDNNFAKIVEFHLSKDELEAQTREIHERVEESQNQIHGRTLSKYGGRETVPSMTFTFSNGWIFKSASAYYTYDDESSKFSTPYQEELLVRDLINVFSGLPTVYIKTDATVDQIAFFDSREMEMVRFRIDDSFSGTFRTLGKELLPMIGHFINIQGFIDEITMTPRCRRSYLTLATCLGNALQKFYDLQSKLETELNDRRLRLHYLVDQMRPWLTPMHIFCRITGNLRNLNLNSARLLSLLDDFYQIHELTINSELKECLSQMLAEVSSGYMKMVQQWSQKGIIYDQEREFFIEDKDPSYDVNTMIVDPGQCSSSYWNLRYRLHTDRLPIFLVEQADIIFLAGKYLNILHQCNVRLPLMNIPLTYECNDLTHMNIIQSSYELPAKRLLNLLLKDYELGLHLRNLRCFCLLQHSSFADDLVEQTQAFLQQRVYRLNVDKFERLLDKVFQSFEDPFKELVHIQLKVCDVVKQFSSTQSIGAGGGDTTEDGCSSDPAEYHNLYGYETVALRYDASWPVSLVLNSQRLEQIQILQRILFFLRYVQYQLQVNKKEAPGPFNRWDNLRERMRRTMCSLEQHMAVDIIQPRWMELIVKVNQAVHIDEVLSAFKFTLDQCMQLCLFSELTYVRAIFTLGRLCLNYCSFLDSPKTKLNKEQFAEKLNDYERDFDNFMINILNLVRQLAKSGGRANIKEPRSSKKLLIRLESIGKGTGPMSK